MQPCAAFRNHIFTTRRKQGIAGCDDGRMGTGVPTERHDTSTAAWVSAIGGSVSSTLRWTETISNGPDTIFVVFNGEIYIYRFAGRLEKMRACLQNALNTEVIVHGYEEGERTRHVSRIFPLPLGRQ